MKKKVWPIIGLVLLLFVAGTGYALFANYHNWGNLARVITLIRSEGFYSLSGEKMVEGAAEGVVQSLHDPYSTYLTPEKFKELTEQIQGAFGGLGIVVGMEKNQLTVVRPYENTPAAKVGIKTGDVITKIDSQDAKDLDLDKAVTLMRGPVGTKVSLQVNRKGQTKPLSFNLVREEIQVPTVTSQILPNTQIGYVLLTQFTQNTPTNLDAELDKLKKKNIQALILDLRFNPGGEVGAAVSVADHFVSSGKIVTIDNKSSDDQTFYANKEALNLPMVVLQNAYSASASEILAGCLKDHKTALIVGSKSYGKGIVQTIYPLSDGAGLKLTTARYLTPAGQDIHKKGIQPDIKVDQPDDAKEDLQLKKAVEILKQRLAS